MIASGAPASRVGSSRESRSVAARDGLARLGQLLAIARHLTAGRGSWPQASSKRPCSRLQLLHAALVALGVLAKIVDGIFVSIMLQPRPPAGTEHEVSVFPGRRPGPG